MQVLLGTFGFAKIPREIVQASMHQTAMLEAIDHGKLSVKDKEFLRMCIEYAKALTRFLSSGRLLQ